MKTRYTVAFAFMIGILAGCNRGPQGTVEGTEGKKMTVAVTDKMLAIEQGQSKKFTVTITREKLKGTVKVKFTLPDKLKIEEAESEWTFPNDKNQKFFTLHAGDDAEPAKNVRIRVTAIHPELKPAEADLNVKIEENLENKSKRQNAFASKYKQKIDEIKSDLKNAELMIVRKINDPGKKAVFTSKITKIYERLDKVNESWDKVKSASAETWERNREAVVDGLDEVREAVDGFIEKLKEIESPEKKKS